jgi:hypothetical protein
MGPGGRKIGFSLPNISPVEGFSAPLAKTVFWEKKTFASNKYPAAKAAKVTDTKIVCALFLAKIKKTG